MSARTGRRNPRLKDGRTAAGRRARHGETALSAVPARAAVLAGMAGMAVLAILTQMYF